MFVDSFCKFIWKWKTKMNMYFLLFLFRVSNSVSISQKVKTESHTNIGTIIQTHTHTHAHTYYSTRDRTQETKPNSLHSLIYWESPKNAVGSSVDFSTFGCCPTTNKTDKPFGITRKRQRTALVDRCVSAVSRAFGDLCSWTVCSFHAGWLHVSSFLFPWYCCRCYCCCCSFSSSMNRSHFYFQRKRTRFFRTIVGWLKWFLFFCCALYIFISLFLLFLSFWSEECVCVCVGLCVCVCACVFVCVCMLDEYRSHLQHVECCRCKHWNEETRSFSQIHLMKGFWENIQRQIA